MMYIIYRTHVCTRTLHPLPREKNGARDVVCVCVCAFRLFCFALFEGLGVDGVVVGLMMSWGEHTAENGTGMLKSRGFEVVSIPRRNCGAMDPRGMHATGNSINSIVGIGWLGYPCGILYAMLVRTTYLCIVSWFLDCRTFWQIVKIVECCGFVVHPGQKPLQGTEPKSYSERTKKGYREKRGFSTIFCLYGFCHLFDLWIC